MVINTVSINFLNSLLTFTEVFFMFLKGVVQWKQVILYPSDRE